MVFMNKAARALLRAAGPLLCGAPAAFAHTPDQTLPDVVVQEAPSVAEKNKLPLQTESVTAGQIADKVNLMNTEDAIKYLPSILVRKRHVGDTQAPFSTRTSGVGSSARGLVYADGVLLSALIGNNNSAASPKWGMVAPDEIERIDVMYGPFAAQYPGNSIGAVVEITTRMPRAFEASAKVEGATQRFSQYGTSDTFNAYQASALLGNRNGNLSWWLSVNHLDSHSQPLAYVTALRPAAPSGVGTPVSGAFTDVNRTGASIQVIGAGGIEHHLQDNFKFKVAYDITPTMQAAYSVGLFQNDDKARVQTYLRDAAGNPVYATSTLPPGGANIGGFNYTIPNSAFSNNYYNVNEQHWMHSLAVRTTTRGEWDWEAVASTYRYGENVLRTPTGALPGAAAGGPGTIALMDGTGWSTLDLKGFWRPQGYTGPHQVSFGAHRDYFRLVNPRYNTSNWIGGSTEQLAADSRGKTQTDALWLQDAWAFAPRLRATLGARYEHWRAYDGFNFALATPPATTLSVNQPELSASRVSPKASIAWTATDALMFTASVGKAYRFPTVTELYQAVTVGPELRSPNPNLRPERAWSGELSGEYAVQAGRVRVSLFEEHISDALISQTTPFPGTTTPVGFVQNVDKVRSRGVEFVAQAFDVAVRGLELSGSVTYVESRIRADAALPAAVGKHTPQVPTWRATAVATYHATAKSAVTLAGRYSGRVYATPDNSDVVTNTYQGFDGYFVMDARFRYQIDRRWGAAIGVDNLNNRKYFLFHPFPQRTVVAELKFNY
ncbi:MAG: TonB-dependent receptor [Betaproteobacteria bacterium]|nr:TonB-dependent receptor [Betaproteobacteria bacterium]